MKKKLFKCLKVIIGLTLIGLLIFAITYGCLGIYKPEDKTETTITVKKVDTQPLIIDIPKASDTGSLTVKDAYGNIYFNYIGKIDIQNDGKNGQQIKIEVIVPSEEETEITDDN